MNIEDELFFTKDFYLAAFLLCKDLKLIGADKIKYEKDFYFKFERISNLDTLITSFYAGREDVNANRFINEVRNLKALVHNIK